MNDHKLLELAAKAAGFRLTWGHQESGPFLRPEHCNVRQRPWNPLSDDGDAQRLAVKLGITFMAYPIYAEQKHSVIAKQYRNGDLLREANPTQAIELYGDDPYAATRRAIVRSAAEIGRAMP